MVIVGATNWIPSLRLEEVILGFSQASWASTRDEFTSMDTSVTIRTPVDSQGKFCLRQDSKGRAGLVSLDVAQIFFSPGKWVTQESGFLLL